MGSATLQSQRQAAEQQRAQSSAAGRGVWVGSILCWVLSTWHFSHLALLGTPNPRTDLETLAQGGHATQQCEKSRIYGLTDAASCWVA